MILPLHSGAKHESRWTKLITSSLLYLILHVDLGISQAVELKFDIHFLLYCTYERGEGASCGSTQAYSKKSFFISKSSNLWLGSSNLRLVFSSRLIEGYRKPKNLILQLDQNHNSTFRHIQVKMLIWVLLEPQNSNLIFIFNSTDTVRELARAS